MFCGSATTILYLWCAVHSDEPSVLYPALVPPQVYLLEAGLELWLSLLRHANAYDAILHALFPRLPDMLDEDVDSLKQACHPRRVLSCTRLDPLLGQSSSSGHTIGPMPCNQRFCGFVRALKRKYSCCSSAVDQSCLDHLLRELACRRLLSASERRSQVHRC